MIPAYNVQRELGQVLIGLPAYVRHAVVVDDASTDSTWQVLSQCASQDSRIVPIRHRTNEGVGGAMRTGFKRALALRAQVVVKVDGDGQMDMAYLPSLLLPLIGGNADYAKGNRFRDFQSLSQMPPVRRAGNVVLSFLVKAATGYWNCFDPTNGFFAIRGDVLAQLKLETVHESVPLRNLHAQSPEPDQCRRGGRADAGEYGDETSNLSIRRVIGEFPGRLMMCFGRRIILKHFLYDFTMESVYFLCGVPLLVGGIVFGGVNWIHYLRSASEPPQVPS